MKACLLSLIVAATPAYAIVDGQIMPDSHPLAHWVVGIKAQRLGFTSYCSGTLISPTQVLTAAHCVEGALFVKVKFAADTNASFFSARLTRDWKFHPSYQPDGDDAVPYDIAIVNLSHAAPKPYTAAHLGWGLTPVDGSFVTATGFGVERLLAISKRDVGTRKWARMKVFSSPALVENWPVDFFAERDLALGKDAGSTAEGDSGGGVFIETSQGYALVGINEGGNPTDRSSMFQSLDSLKDWLQAEIH